MKNSKSNDITSHHDASLIKDDKSEMKRSDKKHASRINTKSSMKPKKDMESM